MSNAKGYSFGMRIPDGQIPSKSLTPGPSDYSTSCLTRFGKLSSPAYSIKSKGYDKQTRSLTPSPLDYQSISPKVKTTKSYSFGFGNRTAFTVKSDTPPPNTYSVPTTIGNNVPDKKKIGRAFSMQGRRKHTTDGSTTPGPGAYETVSVDVYKRKEPSVPFTGRRQAPFRPVDFHLPGPSEYNTLNCKIEKVKGTCAPRAPFGIRHSPKKVTVFTQADILY
ncbi:hypothetical protein RUM43_003343 [Polyplax serrata]|uniref:Uncharacterized protein n=1 Tax=Polyplax serrata TaxID=468196 RepID=A0AAN8S9D5_POLSC